MRLIRPWMALCARAVISVGVLLSATAAQADVTDALNRGGQWLAAQVQSDGTVATGADGIATALQTRTEVSRTLQKLGPTPAALLATIGADSDPLTESHARKVVALAANSQSATASLAVISARQNADGGFGSDGAYPSSQPDSAWSVLALAYAGQGGGIAAQKGRAFLTGQLASDGSPVSGSTTLRLESGAISLSAFRTGSDFASQAAAAKLQSWLLSQQKGDGSWLSDPYLTALITEALAPTWTDAAARGGADAFLLAKQGSDGSWGGDSFVTAIALRALSARPGQSGTPPQGGSFTGTVVDAITRTPLAGVTVSLSGTATAVAATDTTGRFTVAGLAAGSYSSLISRSGYQSAGSTFTLNPSQTLDAGTIALQQLASAGIVRGQVTAAADGAPLAGVQITLSGGATLTAVTDSAGAYEFNGVAPGTVTLSATLNGYQTAGGSGNLAAGATLIFSPALYATGTTVSTTARFTGQVVIAGTGSPLAGAAVIANGGTVVTTGADGRFDVTVPAASYTLQFSMAGYGSASANLVAAAGSTVDFGVIPLVVQRTDSEITGVVSDANGAPIAGATVQLVGGASVSTGADGRYLLAGLSGLSFDLRASAAGYDSQAVTLQVAEPSAIRYDFSLATQSSAVLTLDALLVNPQVASANVEIVAATQVSNSGTKEAAGVLMLRVYDANGQLVGSGSTTDMHGDALGQFTLAAGQQIGARLTWNTAQFGPGGYTLVAQVVEPGSMSLSNPLGTVIVERSAPIAITGTLHFTGSVIADPPVLRAGLNTPVHLSAVVQNDGNQPLPAQSYTLRAVNTKDGSVAMTQAINGAAIVVGDLASFSFNDWTPASAGDYRVQLVAADASQGLIETKVYVGDAASATFSVDKVLVPAGTQKVHGIIAVKGQDVENGSISDPLAPLVRTAITKSVAKNDQLARDWTMNNRCQGCHIQTQALVGGELNRRFGPYNALQRATIFNINSLSLKSDGRLDDQYNGYTRTLSMLTLWALNAYHDSASLSATLKRSTDWMVGQQASGGNWTNDYVAGWWGTDVAITAFNLKNMIASREVLEKAAPGSIRYYSLNAYPTAALPTNRAIVTRDSAGNLYYSGQNGTVTQIKPNGTLGTVWKGLNDPRGTVEAWGKMAVATSGGVMQLNTDGTVTKLNNATNLVDLVMDPSGTRLYSAGWWNNAIYTVDQNWNVTTWYSGTPLNNPYQVTFASNGDLIVVNYSAGTVLRFAPNKSYTTALERMNGSPLHVLPYGDGWLVGGTTGVYRFNAAWEGERFIFGTRVDHLLATPDNRILGVTQGSAGIVELIATAQDPAASIAAYAQSISKATTWLSNLNLASSSSNLDPAHQLIGLGEAYRYYQTRDPARAQQIKTKLTALDSQLRGRQRSDGGWGRYTTYASDSLVTAQVGIALDVLDPSPSDPLVRKAVTWLLSQQKPDGTWVSQNGILTTPEAATTWVSIWLPIILDRLGGIDTDLIATLAGNVTLSSPDVTPTSTKANGDGTTTYIWKMVGVTAEGRTVGFDLTLANMAVNEVRPVAVDAHLAFNNTFTNQPVTAPIDVPRVTASAFLALGVTTDRVSYAASMPVMATAQVTNTSSGGGALSSGTVSLGIYAPDGMLVTDLGTQPFSGLAAGASTLLYGHWNTGATLADSGYYVLAKLYDGTGSFVGEAKSAFDITAGDGNSPQVTATISTDKATYEPSETVNVADRITNPLANQSLRDAQVVTTVTDPNGTLLLTRTEALAELAPQGVKQYGYTLPLAFGPSGEYLASLQVNSSAGQLLARSSTTFTVRSSGESGAGLTGSLMVNPHQLPQGEKLTISYQVGNVGNAPFTTLPITVSLIDPNSQQVVAQFPATIDLDIGKSYVAGASWTGAGSVGTTYIAVLSAVVNGNTRVLAQDSFTLVDPPVSLEITQAFPTQGRVLALAGCTKTLSATDTGGLAACTAARTEAIDALLAGLGIGHYVTDDVDLFRKALRSGYYNVVWISGRVQKLKDDLAEEVRESAFRANGLLIDGDHDERNKVLDEAVGVVYLGKLGAASPLVTLSGGLLGSGALNAVGQALKLELAGGVQEATVPGNGTTPTVPAIISRDYGSGHSLLFGFGLVESVIANAAWRDLFVTALTHVTPAASDGSVVAGGYVPLRTVVANLAKSVDVQVDVVLPAGAQLISSEPAATFLEGVVSFTFHLDEAAEQTLDLAFTAPTGAGSYVVSTTVTTTRNGVTKPYGGVLTQALTVSDAVQALSMALSDITALQLTDKGELRARDDALASLSSAKSLLAATQYNGAITALVAAVDVLRQIGSVDVSGIRLTIDAIIQESEWRWFTAQP